MRELRFKSGEEMKRVAIYESFYDLMHIINKDLGTNLKQLEELNNGIPPLTWENLYKCYYNYAILLETPLMKALREESKL